MEWLRQFTKGQSLIEVILVMGLASILLPALLTGLITSRSGQPNAQQRLTAVALANSTAEALRVVREKGWVNVAVNGTFHPLIDAGTWSLSAGTDVVGDFTRGLVISDVFRDSSGAIVTSGGSLDPSTKKVVVTVSWENPLPQTVTQQFYLTRYLENLVYTQTSESDFSAGTRVGTTVTNTAGGEVILASGGGGEWCAPSLTIAALDLPKNGVANALTAIEGQAFAGTGDNASGVSFANVSISNANPPVASITGTSDGFKTNGIFGEAGYAFLVTDNNAKELEIVNLSATPYTEAGYFNSPGVSAGTGFYVQNNIGYLTAGNKLYSVDLSSKSGSRPALDADGVTLAGTGTSVTVNGNYAYISVSGSGTEFQVVDVTDPANLQVIGQADVDGQGAADVYVNFPATRAYLATGQSATQRELFIIDISEKTGNRPVMGSYESNGMSPKALTMVPGNKVILVGTDAEEYQVIDVTTEATPSHCGGLSIDTGINGVASVTESDGDAYSYIITGDASAEFKIIEGGPGGHFASTGTFQSFPFDPGFQTAFNRLFYTVSKPTGTDISFQVAVADSVSGSCQDAEYIYVGPDGTSATFFQTTPAAIPLDDDGVGYENPGRCLSYRAYFSTADQNSTSVLYDISFNYSP